jgi:hypothetical protein
VGRCPSKLQEVAEGLPRVLDHRAVALEEEHRRVDGPRDVVREAASALEHVADQPLPRGVDVEPDLGAVAPAAEHRPLVERGVREDGGHERGETERHAERAHRRLLAGVVEVRLHGGGAAHHVEAVRAARRQVAPHDRIARLGHPGEIGLRREGVEPDAEPDQLELGGDVPQLREVPAHLHADLVDVLEGRSGQLELSAWLEGHRGASPGERDQRTAGGLVLGCPAVPLDERLEHAEDAPLALVGDGSARFRVDPELLCLSADPVKRFGLRSFVKGKQQIVERLQRLRLRLTPVACIGHHHVSGWLRSRLERAPEQRRALRRTEHLRQRA